MRTLIILSHPDFANSLANKTILNEITDSHLDFELRHLDSLYTGYQIDVEAEQNALINADNIVWQFPFYWYSVPASLKNWMDKVLSFNFAYGPEGDKLAGKNLIISTTIGGPAHSYQPLGYNHFRVIDFLKPLEQTAYLAKMNYLEPIHTNSCVYIPGVYNVKEEVEERARSHAAKLIQIIRDLDNLLIK